MNASVQWLNAFLGTERPAAELRDLVEEAAEGVDVLGLLP